MAGDHQDQRSMEATGAHTARRSEENWPNPQYGTSSAGWVVLPWRFGIVHEFTGTWAERRNSGPGHEKAADAGLNLLLWGSDNCL